MHQMLLLTEEETLRQSSNFVIIHLLSLCSCLFHANLSTQPITDTLSFESQMCSLCCPHVRCHLPFFCFAHWDKANHVDESRLPRAGDVTVMTRDLDRG